MLLGDRIKKATSTLGVKPCSACEERATMLNQLSRRGFFGGAALLFFYTKNAIATGLWQLVGAAPPIGVKEALGFIRQFNTTQLVLYYKNDRHATQDEAFQEMIKHKEHFKPGTLAYAWMSRFNPFSNEVLPGWTLDFSIVHDGYPRHINAQDVVNDGYRFILRGERYTLITDETAVIYQVKTPATGPPASGLAGADTFPGAVPYVDFKEELSRWDKFKQFLIPVAYAQMNCCN